MFSRSSSINSAVPAEYRSIAESLFSTEGARQNSRIEAAGAFAEILGISADYQRLLRAYQEDAPLDGTGAAFNVRHFLRHFQNNLDLLIQKTWVDQTDENRKAKLQMRVPSLIAAIEQEQYPHALGSFSLILKELAYLLFGSQSYKEDFTEYTFRIDTQMGLFWWYGEQIGRFSLDNTDPAGQRAILLLGICYLTNF